MVGNNGSLLTIENVTLQDPDHDSIVAFFSNVTLENLKIADSNCNCDLLRNLITPCPPEVFPCTPLNVSLRDQSFTSLKADLRQDINGGFVLSRCLNGTFS